MKLKRTLMGMLILAVLGGLTLSQERFPQDEEGLLKYAQEKLNKGFPGEAERAYERYLESFPKGKYLQKVLYQLGNIKFRLHKFVTARRLFRRLIREFPKGHLTPAAHFRLAESYQRQKMNARAKIEFRKIMKRYPDSPQADRAMEELMYLSKKRFYLSVYQTFTEGEEVRARFSGFNIDKVDFELYKLDTGEVIKAIERETKARNIQEIIRRLSTGKARLLRKWSERFKVKKDRWGYYRWQWKDIKCDVKHAGLYTLVARHGEFSRQVSIIVAKYGIIVRSAYDKTLVFAVDRRFGRPIKDMKLRIINNLEGSQEVLEGKTDENGVFTLQRPVNGVILGIKDGELVLSNSRFYKRGVQEKFYIYTDRPVYRPNQTVYFKAILRTYKDGKLSFKPNEKVKVQIRDPRGNIVYSADVTTNEFGSLSGEFTLGDEPPLGEYRIIISRPAERKRYYWWYRTAGRFRVEEYRKPEYKVSVTFAGGPYMHGDEVSATIQAMYYFGSPVVDADVKYTIYRARLYRDWWSWECEWIYGRRLAWWLFEEDFEEEGYYHPEYYYEKRITEGSGRLDKDGRLVVRFDTQELDHDAVYTVVAEVKDKARRVVSGSGTVRVSRAEFTLGISTDRWVYAKGDKVNIRVRAIDINDRPVKGVLINIIGYNRNWVAGRWDDKEFYRGRCVTDENGVANLNVLLDSQDYILIRAEAEDKRGNIVSAERGIWISNWSYGGRFQNFNGLDIIPDKKLYKDGETAKILITSQYKNVHVLLTLERDSILESKVIFIKGHSRLLEIPIKKAHSPNIFVRVSTLMKNQYLDRSKLLIVPDSDKFVNVKITTDRPQYRPRETARYTIQTTDSKGRPISCELSIGIVDESIYAIQKEYAKDIRRFFFGKRFNEVQNSTSLHYWEYGRRAKVKQVAERAAPDKDRVLEKKARSPRGMFDLEKLEEEEGDYAQTETRMYFPDTMFWIAHVKTGKDGRVVIDVPIADSLTTWRATLRAISTDLRVGNQTQKIIVRKEVIIRLITPRFFTQKDQTTISAVIHNYAGAPQIKVILEAEGIEVFGPKELLISIPQGEDRRVDWKVKVPYAGFARITAKALTRIESDAMQLVVPIIPYGVPEFCVLAGMAEGEEERIEREVCLPGDAIKGASELRVVLSPSVAKTVLDALEYLAGYPYGCVEQTMSRFLPSVVTAQALQKLGIKNKRLQKELPRMVMQGLQRLYNFQHWDDGGWGWWEHDKTHPFMTAYVIYGLVQALQADFYVDPGVLKRGINCLLKLLKDEGNLDTRAYMIYALTFAKKATKEMVEELYEDVDEMSDYSRGLLAYSLWALGMKEKAREVMVMLDKNSIKGQTKVPRGRGWMDSAIETTAYILKSKVAVEPENKDLHKIVRWLVSKRRGNCWYSTKDTSAIVYALVDYLAISDELNPDFKLKLTLNGKEILSEQITKENMFKFNGVRIFKEGEFKKENEIVIEKKGRGNLYWSIVLKHFTSSNFDEAKGIIEIERRYSKIVWEDGRRFLEELEDGDEVKVGDEIEVEVDIYSTDILEYIMIEDPLPSGFEPVKDPKNVYNYWNWRWGYWYCRKEYRDEKVTVAVTSFPRMKHQKLVYVIRAETPGEVFVLPTYAYNMYSPEIQGRGTGFRLRVVE
jgi:hypothetical protein